MAKTNTGLVAYAKANIGNPYWYGTFGQVGTQTLLDSKRKQYPSFYTSARYAACRMCRQTVCLPNVPNTAT